MDFYREINKVVVVVGCIFLQLAVECMTEEEVMALYISRAQELERDGKFKEAER